MGNNSNTKYIKHGELEDRNKPKGGAVSSCKIEDSSYFEELRSVLRGNNESLGCKKGDGQNRVSPQLRFLTGMDELRRSIDDYYLLIDMLSEREIENELKRITLLQQNHPLNIDIAVKLGIIRKKRIMGEDNVIFISPDSEKNILSISNTKNYGELLYSEYSISHLFREAIEIDPVHEHIEFYEGIQYLETKKYNEMKFRLFLRENYNPPSPWDLLLEGILYFVQDTTTVTTDKNSCSKDEESKSEEEGKRKNLRQRKLRELRERMSGRGKWFKSYMFFETNMKLIQAGQSPTCYKYALYMIAKCLHCAIITNDAFAKSLRMTKKESELFRFDYLQLLSSQFPLFPYPKNELGTYYLNKSLVGSKEASSKSMFMYLSQLHYESIGEKINPRLKNYNFGIARTFHEIGDEVMELKYYNLELENNPDFYRCHVHKTSLLMDLKDNDNALESNHHLIRLNDKKLDHHLQRSKLYKLRKNLSRSIETLEHALQFTFTGENMYESEKVKLLIEISKLYNMNKNWRKAVDSTTKCLKIRSTVEEVEVYRHRGDAEFMLGAHVKAIKDYGIFIKFSKDNNCVPICNFLKGIVVWNNRTTYSKPSQEELANIATKCFEVVVERYEEKEGKRIEQPEHFDENNEYTALVKMAFESLFHLGGCHLFLGNWKRAYQYRMQAMNLFDEKKDLILKIEKEGEGGDDESEFVIPIYLQKIRHFEKKYSHYFKGFRKRCVENNLDLIRKQGGMNNISSLLIKEEDEKQNMMDVTERLSYIKDNFEGDNFLGMFRIILYNDGKEDMEIYRFLVLLIS